MEVLALTIELHFPVAQSLKEKRALLRPLVDGIGNRFTVSVAEVAYQDLWQRAEVGVAIVSGTAAVAAEVGDEVERFVWSFPEFEVTRIERQWMEVDK